MSIDTPNNQSETANFSVSEAMPKYLETLKNRAESVTTDAPIVEDQSDYISQLDPIHKSFLEQQRKFDLQADAYATYRAITTPSQELGYRELSIQTGLPLDYVKENAGEVRNYQRRLEAKQILKDNPELLKTINDNPAVYGAMSRGDVNAMSKLDTSFWSQLGRGYNMSKVEERINELSANRANGKDFSEEQKKEYDRLQAEYLDLQSYGDGNWAKAGNVIGALTGGTLNADTAKVLGGMTLAGATAINYFTEPFGGAGKGVSTMAKGVANAITKLGTKQGLSAMGTALKVSAPFAVTTGFAMHDYKQTTGRILDEHLKAGIDYETAKANAEYLGRLNMLLDYAFFPPMAKASTAVNPVSAIEQLGRAKYFTREMGSVGANVAESAVTNGGLGAVAQLEENAVFNESVQDPNKRKEFDANVLENATLSGLTGGIFTTLASAPHVVMGLGDLGRYNQLKGLQTKFEDAVAGMEDMAKSPNAHIAFANQLADKVGFSDYLIDPHTLWDTLNNKPDEAIALMDRMKRETGYDLEKKIKEAIETGDDLRIDNGHYIHYFLNQSPFKEDIQKISRKGFDGLSAMEADELHANIPNELKKANDLSDEEIKLREARTKELDEIKTTYAKQIKDALQLSGKGADLKSNSAELVTTIIDTFSDKLGISPKEFVSKYGLTYDSFTPKEIQERKANGQDANGSYFFDTRKVFFAPKATASTVVHETGHWFLDVLDNLKDNEALAGDLEKLYNFLGTDKDSWAKMSQEQKAIFHEKFSYSFEEYMKDPSSVKDNQVRGMFQWFRNSLLSIYKTIKDGIAGSFTRQTGEKLPKLNKEITSFFDEYLKNVETINDLDTLGVFPKFDDEFMSKLSAEDREAIEKSHLDTLDEALAYLQKQSVKNTKILNARAKGLGDLKTSIDNKRREITEQEYINVHNTPSQKIVDLVNGGFVVNKDGTKTFVGDVKRVLNKDEVLEVLTEHYTQKRITDAYNSITKARKEGKNNLTDDEIQKILDNLEQQKAGAEKAKQVVDSLNRSHLLGKADDPNTVALKELQSKFSKPIGEILEGFTNIDKDGSKYNTSRKRKDIKGEENQAYFLLRYGEAHSENGEVINLYDRQRGISKQSVEELLGDSPKAKVIIDGLTKRHILTNGKDSYHIDEVQSLLGVENMKETLEVMYYSPNEREMVKRNTNERLLKEFSDYFDPDFRENLIAHLLSGEATNRYYSAVIRAFEHLGVNSRENARAIKSLAQKSVNRMIYSEIKPNAFLAQEKRYQREATKALMKGNLAQASDLALRANLAHEKSRVALQIKQDYNKMIRTAKEITGGKLNTDLYDVNWLNVAKMLLEKVSVGGKVRGSEAILNVMREHSPDAYARYVEINQNNYKHIDQMTVDEMREFATDLNSLVVMAHQEKVAMNGEQEILVTNLVGDFVKQSQKINKTAKDANLGTEHKVTKIEKARNMLTNFLNNNRTVESMLETLTGGIKKGKIDKFVYHTFTKVREASVNADNKIRDTQLKFIDIIKPLELEKVEKSYTFRGYTFNADHRGAQEIFMLLLNAGNKENWERLVLGGRTTNKGGTASDLRPWGEKDNEGNLNDSDIKEFIQTLIDDKVITKDWFDALQKIYDLYGENRQGLQDAYYKTKGRYYKEVEADFQLKDFAQQLGSEVRGGYIPIKYDNWLFDRTQNVDLDVLRVGDTGDFLPNAMDGFLKDRTGGINAGVSLDIKNILSSLNQQIWYANVQPAVSDVAKIIRQPDFIAEMGRVSPNGIKEVLKPWLVDIAKRKTNEKSSVTGAVLVLRGLVNRASAVLMTGNIGNIVQEISGVMLAFTHASPKHVAYATSQTLSHLADTSKHIGELSPFMKDRQSFYSQIAMNWHLGELLGDSKYERLKRASNDTNYFGQAIMQSPIDNIVWLSAYNDFKEKSSLPTEEREKQAIAYADSAVAKTQTSLRIEDSTNFQRSLTPVTKAIAMFQSYFIMLRNLQPSVAKTFEQRFGIPYIPSMLASWFTVVYSQFLIGDMIINYVHGNYSDDDKNGVLNELTDTMYKSAISSVLTPMIPLFGGTIASTITGGKLDTIDRRYTPATVSTLSSSLTTARKALTGELKYEDPQTAGKLIDLITMLTGLNVLEYFKRPVKGALYISQGKTTDTADSIRAMLVGTQSKAGKKKSNAEKREEKKKQKKQEAVSGFTTPKS